MKIPAAVTVIGHPLLQHKLTRLRDAATPNEEFRRLLAEMAGLMVYEATRDFAVARGSVRTPLMRAPGWRLRRDVLLVPVLRAGLGLLPGVLQLIPHANVGFIGLRRNEHTLEAESYHQSLPKDLRETEVLLLDPMLATGGSAVAALRLLRASRARRVRLVSVLAAPAGCARVHQEFPGLPIFTAAWEKKLNARGFILPGLGDAGDRLFGAAGR